jgi:Ca2+-binding RTX toxin-like protein
MSELVLLFVVILLARMGRKQRDQEAAQLEASPKGANTCVEQASLMSHNQNPAWRRLSTSYQSGANTTLVSNGHQPNVLDGSAGRDVLIGSINPDVLVGGGGDRLTGGSGPDNFLFGPNFGANTITDFNVNNDTIQFDGSIFSSVSRMFWRTLPTALTERLFPMGLET